MERKRQPKWKRLLPPVLWGMAGIGLFILLISASGRNEALTCKGLEISIDGYKHEMFISEADIQSLIEEDLSHKVKGCRLGAMDLRRLENGLQRDNWVSKAQLFIDNRQVLHVNISERLPVARIFTQSNRSYYIDSDAVVLPLSAQQVADVPVFTSLPDRPQKLGGADSLLWRQLAQIGNYIITDTFLLMQIGQIDVTPQKEFEIYPVVGNHIVLMGTPDHFQQKLNRLKKFDEQVLAKVGLNKYSRLDLRYNKQIVATIRGLEDAPSGHLNIAPDIEMTAAIQPPLHPAAEPEKKEPVKQTAAIIVKPAPPAKKQAVSEPKKADIKQQIAKTEKKKTETKPEKTVAVVPKKKPILKTEKIVVTSNNKPTKKALEQLPKKTEKPGLIEVDIHRKPEENKSSPKAVMPKKH